ncbi:acyl-CoA reductase [Neobacillus cucumis]|uniref:acyl-CoA reductase n=1 Tax=Neobacillus cucumis TaxID=1740721 RepID=UPI00203FE884|nr:acyl-CoA reductase [Neobacillus cucumis]MCM3728464.1 acyl-CoA reductase [Neobacillus cucumis]
MNTIKELNVFSVPDLIELNQFRSETVIGKDMTFVLKFPVITGEELKGIIEQVQWNRDQYLSTLSITDIVEKIDLAVQKWLQPDYPLRKLAENLIPMITGYDEEMVRLQLKRYIRTFRKKELLRFLDEEFDQPAMLDEFRPRKSGGMSKAFGPNTIFHVFSGNVPGVQVWSIIMGLLVKSGNIGKTSMAEPLFPVLFTKSLAEVDKKLAETIAILPWKGGTIELEEPAIEHCEAVIVYGSNETVEKLRRKVPPHKRFLSYGHKISFAYIGKEALTPDLYYDTIKKMAEDVSIYDQQSCLSPQTIYVEEGGSISSKQFAQMLGAELERYHKKRPRAKLNDEESMAIQRVRSRYQLESVQHDNAAVFSSHADTSWTVIFHKETGFEGSPLNRLVHVYSVESVESVLSAIKPYQPYLQSCGLAVSPNRLVSLANQLGTYGVNRICSIGEMNQAKPGWHHDGRFNLLDLVRMTDIERNLEQNVERYDTDFE